MLLSVLFFCLISFDYKILALTFNDKCTKTCDLPGLVCTNAQCKCDDKNRLFWTGARCAPCPNGWTMAETACITLYETKMPWENAKLSCRKVQAELISFRSRQIIPLLYNATRFRNLTDWFFQTSAWTSAHAINLVGLGEYRWLDKTIQSFDIQSDWWCKKSTKNLGYNYPHDEPTRIRRNNTEVEACAVYWRGINDTQVLCLDDQLCSREFTFMCEKSEDTAVQYLGPAPTQNNQLQSTINNATNTETTTTTTTNPPAKKENHLGLIAAGIIVVFLLLASLVGYFYYYKRRNAARRQSDADQPNKGNDAVSKTSGTSDDNDINKEVSALPKGNFSPMINTQKQIKNQRGGYSKQQFDELE